MSDNPVDQTNFNVLAAKEVIERVMTKNSMELERQKTYEDAAINFGGEDALLRLFAPGTVGSYEVTNVLHIFTENIENHVLAHPTCAMNKDAYQQVYTALALLRNANQILEKAQPET